MPTRSGSPAAALAAALLSVVPLSAFFAINAGSFLLSALLLSGLPSFDSPAHLAGERPRLREAFTVLRPHPWLTAAVCDPGRGGDDLGRDLDRRRPPSSVRRGLHGGVGPLLTG